MNSARLTSVVRSSARAAAAACLAWLLPAAASAVPPGDGAFGGANVVPADVTAMVRVRGARSLRSDGNLLPAQAALLRLAGSRVLSQAWDGLAAELGLDSSDLVDRLLGEDAVYAERTRDGRAEWVIVTRTDQAMQDLLVARLRPAAAAGGRSVYGPQQVAASWRPPFLVFGPADRTGLLDDVVSRIDSDVRADALSASADLAPVASWEPSPVEVAIRHAAPTGGMSAFAVRPSEGSLRIRHRSRFDRAPLHVAPGAPADAGLLAALEGESIAVLVMNPWRGALDAAEPVDAFLLEGGYDEAMRANMGARQVLVVGDAALDGSRVRVPTLAVAFEVRDPLLAEKQWDGWAMRFLESIARRAGLAEGSAAAPTAGAVRQADIAPALRAIFADHPFARPARLSWTTASGANGAWQVVSTDPALLDRVARAIGGAQRAPDPDEANEVGVLAGRALATHLRSWLADPAMFVPEAQDPFVQAVGLAADIVSVAPRVRWRARSPVDGVIESEIVVELPRVEPSASPATQAGPAPGTP